MIANVAKNAIAILKIVKSVVRIVVRSVVRNKYGKTKNAAARMQ